MLESAVQRHHVCLHATQPSRLLHQRSKLASRWRGWPAVHAQPLASQTGPKLPTSTLTNEVILCLVRFGFSRYKLVHLLIRSRNSGSRTGRSLIITRSSVIADRPRRMVR